MIQEKELQLLASAAATAAVRAGYLIMEVYNSDDFQVNLKSDATPLTLADRKAHEEIKNLLGKTRIPVLSEEGRDIIFDERRGWEYFWMVDPLDGTKEFIKRNGEFTVNIALIYKQFPIMGIVYVPVSGELYFGQNTHGAYKKEGVTPSLTASFTFEELLNGSMVLPCSETPPVYTVVGSRSHMSKETEQFMGKLKEQHGEISFLSRGSSLKMCMVAEGKADVYPRLATTSEWDTAAGQAVAEAAGCEVVDFDSRERIMYNKVVLQNPWFVVQKKTK
ncbi:3'(2'),5'-bisphosphate nucleotidase CysQ [Williamwhitmania taraxaci]|uniref:3'(2'),5'-bisphosphate nucleotidase CysQ n=1 Tax=Williamwhitmania taraxaci TaxID=1640674 RepID=A0A1G6GMV3_9BACT|nr:3'(2'),5'-bisphosphate nucleotidase CysQ [Williamwhitmania taraxaci]SDB83278.1 3'(2'),5'-bisphosphate nucleotidase [Williamwhitmania taraxaci]